MKKFFLATLTAVCLAFPVAAQAQDIPSYAAQQYADDQNIHGRVTGFDGEYGLTVRDEQGYLDNVQLHPGTIINPVGLTLAPGLVVSILGYNAGSYFAANEIDTPYQFYSDLPYYAGHPWNYYGPSISLSFFFGNAGWWHGDRFSPRYGYDGGARVYRDVHVNEVYRGSTGEFHGRNYVAPAEHGGYYAHPSRGSGAHEDRDHHDGNAGRDDGDHRR